MISKVRKFDPVLFLPLIFLALIIIDQLFIGYKFAMPFDSYVVKAHLNAISKDLLFPLIFSIFLISLPVSLKIRRFVFVFALLFLIFLPLADLLHFNATLTRFHWKVWHDLNFYSLKATLNPALSILLLSCLAVIFYSISNLKNIVYSTAEKNVVLAKNLARILLTLAITVLLFFPFEAMPENANFTPIIMPIRGKNHYLRVINAGFFAGFLYSRNLDMEKLPESVPYLQQEKEYLQNLGFLPHNSDFKAENQSDYRRIIFIVFESLALEYLHSYNSDIPKEATDFFDQLIKKNQALENFYGSDSPTINGLNAMLLAKIPFTPHASKLRNEKSLATLLKEQQNFKTVFIRGVSKFYSSENLVLNSIFGFDKLIAYEELAKKHPEPAANDWGFHDDVIFNEGINTLKHNKNDKVFLLLKLIDQHQPPHYCGLPEAELPASIKNHSNKIVKMMYWANYCLKQFFTDLRANNLLDKQTLIIITSDHYAFPGFGHQELIKKPFDQLGKIPLIIIDSQNSVEIDKEKMFCQIDLAPTICDLARIKPSDYFIGQSMLSKNSVSRTLGIQEDFIYWKTPGGNLQIDLRNKSFPNPALQKWFNNLFARN